MRYGSFVRSPESGSIPRQWQLSKLCTSEVKFRFPTPCPRKLRLSRQALLLQMSFPVHRLRGPRLKWTARRPSSSFNSPHRYNEVWLRGRANVMIQTLFGSTEKTPGLLERMKEAVSRTRQNLSERIDEVVSFSKEIDRNTLDDLEATLINEDL